MGKGKGKGGGKGGDKDKKSCVPQGFGGTTNGSFYEAPLWVDKSKPPGTTPQVPPAWGTWAWKHITAQSFFFSPTLVWFSVAVFVYVCFPYDYEAAKQLSLDWILPRLWVNFGMVFLYYGFWYCTLYEWGFSRRKFKPQSRPSPATRAHNIWYTSLGTLQSTVWEVVFVHLYASGKLPFLADKDLFATPANVARAVLWAAAIPVWRSTHFYFAHRLIHCRVLYKYVHSLHHRNIDIEPFSGLCMHPVEHLYYFSCLAPSLYFLMSPFHMLWNNVHLLLSPAASHSGWEDHMQSDQFHYLHHAKFECNYGSASVPLDNMFGTFRERLGESKAYRGAGGSGIGSEDKGNGNGNGSGKGNGKGGGGGDDPKIQMAKEVDVIRSVWPTQPMGVYFAGTAAIFAVFLTAAAGGTLKNAASESGSSPGTGAGAALLLLASSGATLGSCPRCVAALLAYGPVALGFAMRGVFGDAMPLHWPFHKEQMGQFAFGLVVGVVLAVVPVYHAAEAMLTERGGATYCQLWGCG